MSRFDDCGKFLKDRESNSVTRFTSRFTFATIFLKIAVFNYFHVPSQPKCEIILQNFERASVIYLLFVYLFYWGTFQNTDNFMLQCLNVALLKCSISCPLLQQFRLF